MSSEIDDIIRSIENRNATSVSRARLKFWIWSTTVWCAYAFKRIMDIIVSLIVIMALSPMMIIVAILIKLTSRGPIIFKQVRVGKDGRYFDFYKFRSMRESAESEKNKILKANESSDGVIFKMKNDPRITGIGSFIRKFSIDELPQLFNVLEGSMSLVGPRPPLPREVMEYTLEDRKRLHVKPGITCIWQVSGRSDIPFKQQVRLDEEYIKTHGIWQDLKLLLRTIPAVITGKGAY